MNFEYDSNSANLYDEEYEYKLLKEYDYLFHDHDDAISSVDFDEDCSDLSLDYDIGDVA